jgi:uncharacterized membrane protein YkoI
MRPFWIGAALMGCAGAAQADGAPAIQGCLDPGEMREIVASSRVVAPAMAVHAARRAIAGAEVVRANLCRGDDRLLYVIMALRRDGRFVHVTIDAVSGKVASVQ